MGVEVMGFGLTSVRGSQVAGLAAALGVSDERWQVWYEQRSLLNPRPNVQTIEAVVSTELRKVL